MTENIVETSSILEDKVRILAADMSKEMLRTAVSVTEAALLLHNKEKDIAALIKLEFDKQYNPKWQCIVGRSFYFLVDHEPKHFVHFSTSRKFHVLLFKSEL